LFNLINLLYFISCGANGIINAISGIDIILDILQNKQNSLAKIFSPNNTVKN
jgi:hypothetical protein